jgi:hypothetical protein
MAAVLTAKDKWSSPVLRSAAIALGMLTEAREKNAADAEFSSLLQQVYERGKDQNARYFALISLGRIGGDSNREFLMLAYQRASKHTERPWAALALGVLAFARATEDGPDVTIAELLLEDLAEAKDGSLRGALAIALGLTCHTPSGPAVARLLRNHEADEYPAGHLCTALALLGDRNAAPQLSSILRRSVNRPFLVRQCAIALGQLGDRNASVILLDMMRASERVAVLSALALGVGRIGDRRSIDPLLEMLANQELTKLARAFVAAALGGIGDKDELPFNAPLTIDSNYTSAVDTLTNGMTGVLDIL